MKEIKIVKMVELKPCPFCGEEEKLQIGNDGVSIECESCGTEGPVGDTEEEMAEKWNNRSINKDLCVFIDKIDKYNIGKPRIFDHILTVREMEELGISHWLFFQCSIETI